MTILIFILVLVVLIVVHEFGHFLVAKWSGMKVEEFGLGYPPRALTLFKKGETEYTLNWLPFGGFVRIYGEDELDRVEGHADSARAFGSRPRILQAVVLLAGIVMNLLFAWVLFSLTLALGTPQALDDSQVPQATHVALVAASVLPGSPASLAHVMPGETIGSATFGTESWSGADATAFTSFVAKDTALMPIALSLSHGTQVRTVNITPVVGIVSKDPLRPALGIGIAVTGILPVAWYQAPIEGAKATYEATVEIGTGLIHFFAGLLTFSADLSQVSGPVGIAGAVGSASAEGITALMTITALISINLALINIIPIPALDGGRLLFVFIEAIIRRPLPAVAARTVNTIGFGLLILLMLVVTAHDVLKLFA